MNLRKSLNRMEKAEAEDLNITPVMNIFLILIPFLLLTAVFVNIAILEFSLPSSDAQARELSAHKKNTVLTILAIRENGFELKSKGMNLPAIPKEGSAFAFESLVERLKQIKAQFPETEDIIISPESTIKYDTIIKVMDRCRENGFPNISISA